MSPEEKAKADEIYKAIIGKERNTLVKRYGKDAEKVAKGRAVKQAQKLAEKKMDPSKDKLREMVKGALMGTNEELKGGQKKLDANKDGKISGEDFAMLRKGKLKEYDPDQAQLDDEDEIPMSYDDEGLPLGLGEDLDLGHEDDEPHMIKAELYRIGKYAMELYQMVDQFEGKGEVDFPAWWQAKITTAKNMVSSAKHYLEFELKEPEVDAMVGVAAAEDIIPNVPTKPLEGEIEENLDAKYTPSEDYKYVVKSKSVIGLKGREDKMYFRTEEAAKAYVADGKPGMRKYLGVEDEIEEGIHDRDITSAPHTNIKGEMGTYDPAKRAASLKRLANFGPKNNNDEIEETLAQKIAKKLKEDVVKGSNIKKDSKGKWRVLSGKTGKMWPQTYDSKADAEDALQAYHATKG